MEDLHPLPVFESSSKKKVQMMIKKSRKIQLPKGWTYAPNPSNNNRFFFILEGELTYEISNQQVVKQKKEKSVDLQAILRGEKVV